MMQIMDTSYNRPDFLNQVDKKAKELHEALNVLQQVDDKISWAHDFASFSIIRDALEPVHDAAHAARELLERELDQLEEKVSEFNFKRLEFEIQHEIELQ